ncbi:hypothetical protein [Methylobacterium sp.]|uniref:hypothetical protein n=1 Tax=Methylobacterium sp. TaxID=409 RepID=UPI00257A5FB9|nr:hypothetical protein [Methylobacterium sp.]
MRLADVKWYRIDEELEGAEVKDGKGDKFTVIYCAYYNTYHIFNAGRGEGGTCIINTEKELELACWLADKELSYAPEYNPRPSAHPQAT